MRVKTIGAGPHPDISKAGSVVSVNGVEIDCEARQGDSAQIIDLRCKDGQTTEGGDGHQVASIHIPPRQYRVVYTGEVEDEDQPVMEREAVPFDPRAVLVTIWTHNS